MVEVNYVFNSACIDLSLPSRGNPNLVIVPGFLQDKGGAPRIGQEPVATDKFWEVMTSYYAEDHKEGWLNKMLDIEVWSRFIMASKA